MVTALVRCVIVCAVLVATTAHAGEVILAASNPEQVRLPAWPVAVCVPFPVGELEDVEQVALVDDDGKAVPAQFSVQTRWWGRDSSVQTILARFVADPSARQHRLVYGPAAPANPAPATPVGVKRNDEQITITNGPLRLVLATGAADLVQSLEYDADGDGRFDPRERVAASGGPWQRPFGAGRSAPEAIEIEEDGPVRAVVHVRGHFTDTDGQPHMGYQLRLYIAAGVPAIQADYTFVQDTGRVFTDVEEVSFELGLPAAAKEVRFAPHDEDAPPSFSLAAEDSLRVLQIGPGRPQTIKGLDYEPFAKMNEERKRWRTPEEDGLWERDEREKEFRAVWRQNDEEVGRTERTDGWVTITPQQRPWALSAGVRWFWQLHPKAIEIAPDRLRLALVPRLDRPLHLHLGTAKTHTILLAFHGPEGEATAEGYRRALARPPLYFPSPEWMCDSGVWGPIHPREAGRFRCYEERVEDWIDRQFADSVRRNSLYGIWDWGDLLYSGGQWLNMETALDYGLFIQFLRTGDRKYYDYFERAVNHFRDVDTSHADITEGKFDYGLWIMPGYMPERLARECAREDEVGEKLRADLFYYLGDQPPPKGGIRRHSFNHYQNAGFNPARLDCEYEHKRGRLYGGTCTIGGHGWFVGAIAHYMLTGDRYSLDTAKMSGELILAKLARPGTGRDNWKMIDVVHMYRVTGDERYRELAKKAIDYHWQRRHEITDRVAAQRESRLMSPYYTIGQFIRDYYDLTGDDEVARRFVAMIGEWLNAAEETKAPTSLGPVFSYIRDFLDSRCHGDFADLAFCHQITGDRSYLDRALPDLELYLHHCYHSTAFFEMPRIMVALAELGIDPVDRPWRGGIGGYGKARAWAEKPAGEPLTVWVSQSSGYRVRSEPIEGKAELRGPDGSVVDSREIVRGGLDAFALKAQAEAPAGVYEIRVEAPKQSLRLSSYTPLGQGAPAKSVETPGGRGVKLEDMARLRYAAHGNVPYERGTLELALQPLWDDPRERAKDIPYHYYHVFDSRDTQYDYGLSLYVWDSGKVNAGHSLIALWADKDKASSVTWPCPWKTGEWHRVAMTWERTGEDTGELGLFVDGEKVASESDAPHFPSRPYRTDPMDPFILGCNATYSPNTSVTAVVDWVRISNAVRTDFPAGQPAADEATTFLATFEEGAPFRADVAAGGGEPQ